MHSLQKKRELFNDLRAFLDTLYGVVDSVIVEGPRDVEALRRLGFEGRIETCSRVGVPDCDLVDILAQENGNVLILTDFDEEGRLLNRKLAKLLEIRGVKVERGMRGAFRRYMAAIGIYEVESLDNVERDL